MTKVAIIGYYKNFNKNDGSGIHKYMYYLTEELLKIKGTNLNINKITFKNRLTYFMSLYKNNLNEYKIIHNPTYGPVLPHKNNKILITTIHDFRSINNTLRNLPLKALSFLGTKTLMKSDYLIANSSKTKEEAVKFGFDKNKIFVVNLGIDKRFLRPIKNQNPNFNIGYIGGSNLQQLINAFDKNNYADIYLNLWGRSAITNLYNYKSKNIKLNGFAPEKNLVDIYDTFSVFISLSHNEGFGLPILEAQARGIPVIIFKDALIPKEIKKYCIRAKDEYDMLLIAKKIKESGFDSRIRLKFITYARSFTWEKTAKETLGVYRKVLK